MDGISKNTTKQNNSIVSIIECQNYDQQKVDLALKHCLNKLDAIDQIIKPDTTIHIKPNLLSARLPEHGITTHPSVVKALVNIIHKRGAKATIGDSPAGITRPIEEYWRTTGMHKVAEETGAQLIKFEKKGVIEKVVNGKSYFIAKPLASADVVINLCKLKTHSLTLYTGAIKNMFGIIPGVKKGEFHKIAPKVTQFSEILVDIFQSMQPQLTIMDAVIGMEGNGPSSGKPKHFGYILASRDAVALDAVGAHIMGYLPDEILTTQIAYRRGLGEKDLDKIRFNGFRKEDLKKQDVLLPSNRLYQSLPEFLLKLAGRLIWIRPKANEAQCRKCGMCIQNCPVSAMVSKDGIPVIDYETCIKCFCCDEICPHDAIDIQMSWLARKLR
ncbi:DUF362 domain-containing protein [candidate division KSB1 bacterium]|nr:DUF362 domain-containing protein [candidate division KSB1 bacterium]